jgi:hypothetical protein
MGQEADADEQLRRRLRRVFAAEERSFRVDRRSEAATALRAAVADVLPRFLGTYSDDTLAVPTPKSPLSLPSRASPQLATADVNLARCGCAGLLLRGPVVLIGLGNVAKWASSSWDCSTKGICVALNRR